MMRQGILWGLLLAALAAIGCSGDLPRGKIKGVVKFKGAPLTSSTVMFMAKDNQIYRAELGNDGSYAVDGVPLGPVKACVQQALPTVAPRPDGQVISSSAVAQKGQMREKRDEKWQPPSTVVPEVGADRVPLKYGDPNQSGLSFELTQAEQEWNADLQ